MDIEELKKHQIEDRKKILEAQKEIVESFKEYFGDYEAIFETIEEVEKKFNNFFQWRNKEWIIQRMGKTPEQLWLEAGNKPIELEKIKLKGKLPKNAKKIGLVADSIFGIVIVPFYGYLREFFEGDYKKVPDYWSFFYEVIAENDDIIPSFVVRNIILKNKENALKIFKEGYKGVKNLDDVFNILEEHREDWDESPPTWQILVDSEKAGTKKPENKEIPKEQLEEAKKSMKEFDLAWEEFFKNKPKPKTDEEDRKQQEEFHHWYNNVKKQRDTGKTPAEMGKRIMNFGWDEDYGEGYDEADFEEQDMPKVKPWEVTLIEKIFLLIDTSFPDEEEKALEKFKEEKKKEIEMMRSEIDFNRGFQAWFLLEYRLPDGKTPLEHIFSRKDSDKLFSKREIKMIESFLAHIQSLFEIRKISKNKKNYTIKNALDNKSYVVKTIDFPVILKIGDFIAETIVQKSEGHYFFYGNVASYSRKQGLKMKDFMLKEIKKLDK